MRQVQSKTGKSPDVPSWTIEWVLQQLRSLRYHIVTLFLFTKSDFKTVILPQSVFALSLVFSASSEAMLPCRQRDLLIWMWLHLLVEDIANQKLSSSLVEDTINKPWRPIPAGRLTATEARKLALFVVLAALVLSILLQSFLPSTTLMTMIWLYNDLDGSSMGPLVRNLLNAAGLACFGWGAVCVLLAGDLSNSAIPRLWLLLTAAMVTSTVHIQDLPDKEGDKARKRRTAPLVYGEDLTRWSVAVLSSFWSLVCPIFWRVAFPYALVPLAISSFMTVVVLLWKDHFYNELGWKLWCLWVTVIFLLPLLSVSIA
ncbi:UbiA prenyltransferase family-domain-containing protein [Xylaria arbuscula]|nr:UbiA prenyltransferase family-domain-containing protein [Xylaria arbuscula]